MRKLTTLILALALPLAAHAEMYKWTDPSGKVHYSDQKPTESQSKTVENAKAAPAAATAAKEQAKPAPKSLADKELEFNKRRKEAQEATTKREQEEATTKEKKENCERSRAALQALQRGDRMARPNEKGETIVMDDKARQQETERTQKQVNEWCK